MIKRQQSTKLNNVGTSHLVNTSRDTFIAFITENGNGFSSSVPKIGTKTKHALLTMNHNIAQELLKVWSMEPQQSSRLFQGN